MDANSPRKSRAAKIAAALVLLLAAAFAICEVIEWPFLAAPLQETLSSTLGRNVTLAAGKGEGGESTVPFGVRFLGGIRIHTGDFNIAAPDWSKSPHFLSAQNVLLKLRYIDLWRAHEGKHLRIDSLSADSLDGNLERLDDGRASWQFGKASAVKAPPSSTDDATDLSAVPLFGNLDVTRGVLRYQDALLRVDALANLSLDNGATGQPVATPSDTAPAKDNPVRNVLKVVANGTYRDLPFKLNLASNGVLPWTSTEVRAVPVPVSVQATAGGAHLIFNGTASDAMHLKDLSGRFSIKGPSLAAAGKPFGVTLPTTGAFSTRGVVVKQGPTWRVLVDDATVGGSRLNAALTYESARAVPLLIGKLGGSRLLLADLAPAIGASAPETAKATAAPGKVLPDRKFELASLRAMDANVLFDVAEVDLNTTLLEPLRPLHGHIELSDGVLKLTELSARTAQGTLSGAWKLDGRGTIGLWTADLRWQDVELDRWLHQDRTSGSAPSYLSGLLNGSARVKGEGQSTAEILATLDGRVFSELENGQMSHLIIELAGLDIAQGLGLLIKGDQPLPVHCAVTEMVAKDGVFQSRVTVIDTPDSTMFVEGTVSLRGEALDLRAVVTPKDFSPLTLRTPLQIRGTFAHPQIAVEKGPLGRKIGGAVLLGLLNPIAALIPLADRGNKSEARARAAGCEALVTHGKEKLAAPNRVK